MADVTNQDKQVASTTSGQKLSTTGATDVNLTPGGVPVPANNYAPTSDATGFATKTETSGGKTLREGDAVGPPSKDPHPGTAGGVGSGTYLDKAEDSGGSPNVKVEGKPVARDQDPTTQNKGNTTGLVQDAASAKELPTVAAITKEECSIVKMAVTCGHGRGLGDEQGTRQLQIIDKDVLKLDTRGMRINAKRSDAGPACAPGNHTEWRVRRMKAGGLSEKSQNFFGDFIVLNEDWFTETSWMDYLPEFGTEQNDDSGAGGPKGTTDDDKRQASKDAARANQPSNSQAKDMGRQEYFKRRAEHMKDGMSKYDAGQAAGKEMAGNRQDKTDARKRTAASAAMLAAERLGKLAVWLRYYYWDKDPGHINIQGLACSGSQSCEIKIFPEGEKEFEFGPEEFDLMKSVFAAIQKFGLWVERLVNLIGGRMKVQIEFLQDPTCTLKTEWKELTREAPNVKKKPYQCNNTFGIDLGFGKLLGVELQFGVPITLALGGIPAIGWALQKIVDYIADLQLGVRIKIDMGLKVGFSTNEYREPQKPTLTLQFTFELFFFASARVGRWLSITVEVGAKWKPTFDNLQQYLPEGDIGFDLAKGAIEPGLRAVIRVSALWWERDVNVNVFPEAWKYKYEKKTFRPLQSLFARKNG